MRVFKIIPKRRDKVSKLMYKLLDHIGRKHGPEIQEILDKAYIDMITTGTAKMTIDFDTIERKTNERITKLKNKEI